MVLAGMLGKGGDEISSSLPLQSHSLETRNAPLAYIAPAEKNYCIFLMIIKFMKKKIEKNHIIFTISNIKHKDFCHSSIHPSVTLRGPHNGF